MELGLAACTAITCEMYAAMKGWELGAVECEVEIEQGPGSSFEEITVTLRVPEALDDAQRDRLLVIAGKCPVHRALSGDKSTGAYSSEVGGKPRRSFHGPPRQSARASPTAF